MALGKVAIKAEAVMSLSIQCFRFWGSGVHVCVAVCL